MTPLAECSSQTDALEAALRALDPDAPPPTQFEQLVPTLLPVLPLPAGGDTASRFAALRRLGRHDLSLARLVEGHVDAVAILAEARTSVHPAERLGVWAAGPVETLTAVSDGDGWRLDGIRRWCSGAPVLTQALIRAASADGERLFLVPLDRAGVHPIAGSWPALGMAGSLTLDVRFDGVRLPAAAAIGSPGLYLDRPGFWFGAAGVAAVWVGGAEAVAATLAERAGDDPHRLAHLGAITVRLTVLDALLATAARTIDEPSTGAPSFERGARILRAEAEQGAAEIITRTGRATGADPLGHDRRHAQRVADLSVYIRQSHAEADLAEIGRIEQRSRGLGER